jgi:hypothetical protein
MGESEHDHPWLVDRIPLEHVERIHWRDANGIGFVGERQGFGLGG